MAKQLNLLSAGHTIPTALHAEMQQSYLEYAMSVIVGRALPDVRDGLKPVHRRILYAMHELGLTHDRPYRKCARVVGDVLGKYHPHGDQAVYDALVRMVQEFSSRYPLLSGHGNFGSVDNDPPAAMRYTETRLSAIGQQSLLAEISEATVNFVSNFDNSQQEPAVLPAGLPVLLLNGCSGIAVGMATNIPPHNLGEIIDGSIALIDHPDLSDEKLFALIPGPDFPTGGEIVETEGIRAAYTTGRGGIQMRGVAKIEEIQGGPGRRRRTAIVVTELPYQVNKAGWIEKVAAACNQSKIEGISDIRDESDRSGMRVVIELKREADPRAVLGKLFHQTALQSNFGAIFLALVDGQPCQLTLRQCLQEFLKFREQTLTRLYSSELQETEGRLHILEGLVKALSNLDATIQILRESPDGTTAKVTLGEELSLSDAQADAILAMPMRRITGLEGEKLQSEQEQLARRREELQRLLGDRRELLKAIKKDLRAVKRKYGDRRRTRILDKDKFSGSKSPIPGKTATTKQESAGSKSKSAKSGQPEETVVEFTHRGYARRLSPSAFKRQRDSEKKTKKSQADKGSTDFVTRTQRSMTDSHLLVLTRTGKAYPFQVGDIPEATQKNSRGKPLVSLLPPSARDNNLDAIATQLFLTDNSKATDLLIFTKKGRIKRLSLSEFENLSGRGFSIVKLKDGDELFSAFPIQLGSQVIMAASGGRLLRFTVNDEELPAATRTAGAKTAMRLGDSEKLVGAFPLNLNADLLLVSEYGYAKRIQASSPKLGKKGDLGGQGIRFEKKEDALASMVMVRETSELVLLTSAERLLPLSAGSVRMLGKDSVGDRLSVLRQEERVVNIVLRSPPPRL